MIVNVQASRCSTRYEFYETTSDNIILDEKTPTPSDRA